MRLTITMNVDVPDNLGDQILSSGFTVVKSGSAMRLRIGTKLIAKDRARITVEVPTDSQNDRPTEEEHDAGHNQE